MYTAVLFMFSFLLPENIKIDYWNLISTNPISIRRRGILQNIEISK